jgi:hypothetical protein
VTTYTATPGSGEKTKKTGHDALLEPIRRCYKVGMQGWKKQREREKDDLEFQIPENQWPKAAREARAAVPGQAIPARPMISCSLTQQPIQLVKNQAAAADLGVSIHPVSETADKEIAEIKQGLYRRIERDSNAELVRLHGLDRGVQAGIGYYRIITQWDEDGDDPFDQEIVLKRILDGSSVLFDPSAQEADFSDAEWCILHRWLSGDTFRRLYPKAKYVQGSSSKDYAELQEQAPEWVNTSGEDAAFLICEYFYKEHEYEERQGPNGRVRQMDKVTVKWCKAYGAEILSETVFPGPNIPVVPVIGRELQPYDEQHRFEGMIRPARDGQQAFNYAISAAVEDVGRLSKVPYIGAAGQFQGFEAKWNTANVRNYPYLEYNPTNTLGQQSPPPQPMQVDGSKLGLSLQLAEMAKSLVQAATAVYDPSLGETPKRGQSGRAVIAQQQQSDAGTSNYLQNLANISMPYEAKVILGMMPFVYDRPGRVTEILGGEKEESRKVMLGAPYVMDQDSQMPMEVQPGHQGAKYHDLTQGKYAISVSIGKSYQTRLQQGQETMGVLLERMPPEIQVLLLPEWLAFMDTPGAPAAAEIVEKFRDSKFPGLTENEEEGPTPAQARNMLKAAEMKLKEQEQMLGQASKAIETDQAKQMATMEKAKIDAATTLEKAKIDSELAIKLQELRNLGSITVAQINAEAKGLQQATEDANEAAATGIEHAFQESQAQEQREHDAQMAAAGQMQQADEAEAAREHETEMTQMGQGFDAEQAEADRQAAAQQEPAE